MEGLKRLARAAPPEPAAASAGGRGARVDHPALGGGPHAAAAPVVGQGCEALGVSVGGALSPAELAQVGTRPRQTPHRDAQDLETRAPRACAACAQPLTTADQRHLAAGGAAHRQCWKTQQPRPALAPCCQEGACGQR